jgi:hypothetical protein
MKRKKILKITGISVLIVLLVLVLTPFLFKGKIESMLKKAINEQVNAKFDFSEVDLSLIRSFPKASLLISDLSLINNAPFEGDTLVTAKEIYLTLSISQLFKSEGIAIDAFKIDHAFINIKIDSLERANYDIAKESKVSTSQEKKPEQASSFSLDLSEYEITNTRINYLDDSAKMYLRLDDFQHSGSGNLSAANSLLETNTQSLISFEFGGTNYFNNAKVTLEADLGIDLENQKYTFKENKALINQLPLVFDGFVQLTDKGQNIDLSFKTPSSSFKNFLAIIPEEYAKNIENVETQGDFVVQGTVKGVSDDTHIPHLDIRIVSEKASFKYPDLPKKVEDIYIKMDIKNKTGLVEDTYIRLDTLCFRIDQDVFRANARFSNLVENMAVKTHIDGKIDLSKVSQAYPISLETPLQGIVKANLKASFDKNAIEQNEYQRIESNGDFSISDFVYQSDAFPNPIKISQANIVFNPGRIRLTQFDATSGKSDIKASGNLDNFLGFLFADTELKGNFDLSSNSFAVSDFMTEEAQASDETKQTGEKNGEGKTAEEGFKIPKQINAVVNVSANQVLYDNLTLKNVKGKAIIKDQKITFDKVTSDIFGGKLGLVGDVSTKNETPDFNMKLNVQEFDIPQAFNGLELFQSLTPLAAALTGRLNSSIDLSGKLDKDFAPDLNSLTGNLLASLLNAKMSPEKTALMSSLSSSLNFLDFSKLNLNDLKAHLDFKDGMVTVKPFQLKYQDIAIDVSGTHGFDKNMNYKATFNVPAKYLGSQASGLLANLSGSDAKNMTVPVTASIGGSFDNPKVNTDMQSAISNLTAQLVNNQKQKLVNQGTGALGNLLGGNKQTNDSIKKDSTTTKKPAEEAAKSLLNNLLGGKKKKKDTVN